MRNTWALDFIVDNLYFSNKKGCLVMYFDVMIIFILDLFCAVCKMNCRTSADESSASFQNLEKFRQSVFVLFFLLAPLYRSTFKSRRVNSNSIVDIVVGYILTALAIGYIAGFIKNTFFLDKLWNLFELNQKHEVLSGRVDPDAIFIASVAVKSGLMQIFGVLLSPNIFNSAVGNGVEFCFNCIQILSCIVLSSFRSVINEQNLVRGCRGVELKNR